MARTARARRVRAFGWLAPVAVLASCAVLAWLTSTRTSITVDEFVHLPRGLWIWHYGDFHLESASAPLPSLLAALPVAASESPHFSLSPATDPTSWTVATQFMLSNAADYTRFYALARGVTILVLLSACLMTWALARRLYGPVGALISLVVIAFAPEMLAHGTLVTADVYLAAAVAGTLWAFDSWLCRPNWWRASLLGLAIGVAVLCKFTGLLLFVLVPASTLVILLARRLGMDFDREGVRLNAVNAAWIGLALLVAVLVINAGYGLPIGFKAVRDYEFATTWLSRLHSVLPSWLPVPLPTEFLKGIDLQFNEGTYESYLLGTFNTTGFWNYYLVGLLVKTPEPILLMVVAAVLLRPRIAVRELPACVVGVLSFGIISVSGDKNIGVRYALFLLPLAAVAAGRIVTSPLWNERRRLVRGGAVACCVWLAAVTMSTWPHFLAYFNRASGGPEHGHTYLLDSNIDWGQDLIGLRDYLRRANIDEIDLAYFGRVDPSLIYGIKFRPLWDSVGHRYAVVSSNLLWGRGYWVFGTGHWMSNHDHYAPFRSRKPVAVIGHSLYVFDLAPN